jgi:hypothetical protein
MNYYCDDVMDKDGEIPKLARGRRSVGIIDSCGMQICNPGDVWRSNRFQGNATLEHRFTELCVNSHESDFIKELRCGAGSH